MAWFSLAGFFSPEEKPALFLKSDSPTSQKHFSRDFTDLISVVETKNFKIVSDTLFSSFRKYPPGPLWGPSWATLQIFALTVVL